MNAEAITTREEELRQLCKRCRDDGALLIIYLRGLIFGSHHVLAAVGVHAGGNNHLLGIAQGASANQAVAQGLRENQVARGRAVAEQPDNQRLAQPPGSRNGNPRIRKRAQRDRLRSDKSSDRFSHAPLSEIFQSIEAGRFAFSRKATARREAVPATAVIC